MAHSRQALFQPCRRSYAPRQRATCVPFGRSPLDIVLYYGPLTCALAPRITLTEANAKFEVRPLNFRKGPAPLARLSEDQSQAQGPGLLIDGQVLTESVRDPDVDRAELPAGEARCPPIRGRS